MGTGTIFQIEKLYLSPFKEKTVLAALEDYTICIDLLRSGYRQGEDPASHGELLLALARRFLGTPYAACTLEQAGEEQLVVNLRQMDCFTFLENSLALYRSIREGKTELADFAAALTMLRYRQGLIKGYPSRLHYFSDWLRDNEKKAVLTDITGQMGGETFCKTINYMTEHCEKYPPLQDENCRRRMREVEKNCSGRILHHIPKSQLPQQEDKIQGGDIIAVTTTIPGLDVIHVGLAVKNGKRRLHFLHASQRAGRVIISGETLLDYLEERDVRQGIMVARVS